MRSWEGAEEVRRRRCERGLGAVCIRWSWGAVVMGSAVAGGDDGWWRVRLEVVGAATGCAALRGGVMAGGVGGELGATPVMVRRFCDYGGAVQVVMEVDGVVRRGRRLWVRWWRWLEEMMGSGAVVVMVEDGDGSGGGAAAAVRRRSAARWATGNGGTVVVMSALGVDDGGAAVDGR
ncbi:hypothetical protein F0562_000927 [Nyssa sinensis]|uniref:Uncharacterized protein n=1 Tax=Nyssa sinensis TaxID=561372 RepID=A0A5J5C1H3_9ASTE|nr:hypothetical protein F0562_000927 [Nyssa sinensis]